MAADRILEGLNEAQRQAVTHDTGPILIVAGAGTGKTTVITRRIAWLIATRRARPDEILALTFTDKAAAEMEERVDTLVPYGYADVEIATFHAFGDRILREHALEIGLTPDFRVLNRAEQTIFFRDRLFELPLAHYRPLGDPTRHLQALITLISRCKDEDISPEEYQAHAGRLEREAAAAVDYEEARERAAQQRELAATYAKYEELMTRDGCVDFGDQIVQVLRLLRRRPYVLGAYQRRFRYILVDEFQDTNHAQFELVKLLAEAALVGAEDIGPPAEQPQHLDDLIAEVDAAVPRHQLLVLGVRRRQLALLGGALTRFLVVDGGGRFTLESSRMRLVFLGRDVLVLAAADERDERLEVSRGIAERPVVRERQLEEPVAEEDGLLGAVQHAEVGRETDLERVLAQDAIAEGVERRDLDVGVAVGHERVDALLHLGGGLVGEGEREDLVRPGPARGDEPGDTSRDDGGLAGSGAGDDQQGPGVVGDGPPLRLVEPLEDAVSRHARSALYLTQTKRLPSSRRSQYRLTRRRGDGAGGSGPCWRR